MKQQHQLSIIMLALLQAACSGGGGGSDSLTATPTATPTARPTASIVGTVPGTLIEAFGDNGSYYAVNSDDNGTSQHPFRLEVPSGLGFHLVMTTGEGTSDNVVAPIGFRDSSGKILTRLVLAEGKEINLGHIPLHVGRNAAAVVDSDDDGVLDHPMVLDDVSAENPLRQSDVDKDGIDDYNDDDHGGYHYDADIRDPQDDDDDGIPNSYDRDHSGPGNGDSDGDGLPDEVDANPENNRGHGNDHLRDDCDGDGYNDEDRNHDGFHDDDSDHDGFHDDDEDKDGRHDGRGGDDDDRNNCPNPTPTATPTASPTPTVTPTPTASPTPTVTPTPTPIA